MTCQSWNQGVHYNVEKNLQLEILLYVCVFKCYYCITIFDLLTKIKV
jgi:hypothetical protein